ncbi:MAG: hypothetical protein F6J93_38460 [Oscillatoria sp. SIO1A7]|nr:hypothetical protein [Oscillatoria sp. SIO1A7]
MRTCPMPGAIALFKDMMNYALKKAYFKLLLCEDFSRFGLRQNFWAILNAIAPRRNWQA